MASGSYIQVDVQCPFYKRDDGKKLIECEGPTRHVVAGFRFYDKKHFGQWIRDFCCDKYVYCDRYRELMNGKYK